MTTMLDALLARLTAAGQEHLVQFWDEIDEIGQARLAEQIAGVDFDQVASLFRSDEFSPNLSEIAKDAAPPTAVRLDGSGAPFALDEARRCGEETLRAGRVGMILVAGGQGSRLGYEHPKGMFDIGPVSKRCLFEVLIDRLRAVSDRYGKPIPLYLMTSPATHAETEAFLAKKQRFGLLENDLHVFCQGTMPAVDGETGKLLLSAKDEIFLSPDGHGGMLEAFKSSGCLAAAKQRGIAHMFYGQVDNPLVQVADPTLIGAHVLGRSEMTTQVVTKAGPLEKVGNVVCIDGQVRIIEYSDLPDDVAHRTTADGSLELWAGNIAVHVFEVDFLKRMVDQTGGLPFHRARKATPFVSSKGIQVKPVDPNAIKFERFIFDLLPAAKNALVVEGCKSECFAPVKNADGAAADTPQAAKDAIVNLSTGWIKKAGGAVVDGVAVEINPRFALDVEELKTKLEPGQTFRAPTYLR